MDWISRTYALPAVIPRGGGRTCTSCRRLPCRSAPHSYRFPPDSLFIPEAGHLVYADTASAFEVTIRDDLQLQADRASPDHDDVPTALMTSRVGLRSR
jgi:hypothetical protein